MDPIILRRKNLLGRIPFLGETVEVDPAEGRISRNGRTIRMADLRHLVVDREFLTIGTSTQWETFDLHRYRDDAGPLVSRSGDLLPPAASLIATLKEAILGNRPAASAEAARDGTQEGGPSAVGYFPFVFRGILRIDRGAVVLTAASVAIFLLDLYALTSEFVLSFPGLMCFLALLLLFVGGLYLKRRASSIRFDAEGVTVRGPLGVRSYPWRDLQEFRRQHGEVELIGDGIRIPLSLDIYAAGDTPLVLRRGRIAIVSLPARLFLIWLHARIPERSEPSLEATPREMTIARWWIGSLVAANAAIFIAEMPFSGERFEERLRALGARTSDWPKEPWRLLTSLFLHGSPSHLFFNMFMLAVLGPWVGRIFGWARALILYLAGGILGNIIGDLIGGAFGSDAISVGASTAILALLGALLGATYRRPERVPLAARVRFRWAIPMTLLFTLGLGIVIPVLDNAAHIGGFAAGLCLAWLIPPRDEAPSG